MTRLHPDNYPIAIAAGFIVLILCAGTVYTLSTSGTATLLSFPYLLQQLQIGAFLGVVAAGAMLVILLGHIDLSVPWTLTTGAMVATAIGGPMAIPAGIVAGMIVGLVNGLGVALLRVPSMIFTLGVNAVMGGLMVAYTGGYAPQTDATPLMRFLASGRILDLPAAALVWLFISLLIAGMLRFTTLGRQIYMIGNSEAASYLSGLRLRGVVIASFAISGGLSALAGVLLAGYSAKAYQGMGEPYLLPAIAAVVIGGTSILGGRGRYAGTIAGVLLMVLLNSVLSIMQMPESGRQIIYGCVITLMLLIYSRDSLRV